MQFNLSRLFVYSLVLSGLFKRIVLHLPLAAKEMKA